MNCAGHVESVRRIPGSWVWGLAHVVGDKLVRAVVVRVQGPNVVANQEGARLCAHVDDQFGRCQGVVDASRLVNVRPDEVAEVVLARGLVVVDALLDCRRDLVVLTQVVVRDHLLPGALLRTVGAAAARIRQAPLANRLAVRHTLRTLRRHGKAAAVVVGRGRAAGGVRAPIPEPCGRRRNTRCRAQHTYSRAQPW